MKLGIMQPYFFPHLGHFALIASVEQWVVFDVTQYTPKSWMNRNRVLHPKEGWNYISAPLERSSSSIRTVDAKISSTDKCMRSLLGKLSHYKNKAPFYNQTIKLVHAAFNRLNNQSLVELNVAALTEVCIYLGIPFNYQICSNLDITFPENMSAGKWAPMICNYLGASTYINPAGGRHLFDVETFKKNNVGLQLLDFTPYLYNTGKCEFVSGLSILDVLMWNEPSIITAALKKNTMIEEVL